MVAGRDKLLNMARKKATTETAFEDIRALSLWVRRNIYELEKRVHHCCSDKKRTSREKRKACEQLVRLAGASTGSVSRLAEEFTEPFREIAERLPAFLCLFPAHVDDLRAVQRIMWDELNLGKRHALKLRAAPGRKTFSKETWVNQLLMPLILKVRDEHNPGVPLTSQNVKQWLDAIWKLLLIYDPNPETHPRLRQLVDRPSLRTKRMRRDGTVGEKTQSHNVRAAIKAKLGTYLKRMLNDPAIHK
jgi:hypothetical protein